MHRSYRIGSELPASDCDGGQRQLKEPRALGVLPLEGHAGGREERKCPTSSGDDEHAGPVDPRVFQVLQGAIRFGQRVRGRACMNASSDGFGE